MKHPAFPLLLLALIWLPALPIVAQPSLKADGKTIAYLERFRADYSKTLRDEKVEWLQVYYADNIRLMPEFQKTVLGKANALLYHQAFSARFGVKEYKREPVEILDLGARVVETGTFTANITLKSTGQARALKGKYQTIWEKFGNNTLSLITDAWNHDDRSELDEHFGFAEVPAVRTAFLAHVPIKDPISFELAALNKLLEVSITQNDHQVWAQFYTGDAVLLPNLSPLRQGREAVETYLEKHVREMPVFEKLDIRTDRIDHLGDYVIEYASHVANWRNGESSGVNTGKDVRIWRREPDGSLKMFRQLGSYD